MAAGQAEIFLSYRRHDSQGFAGRLGDDLTTIFGDASVFRDDEIDVGEDYTQVLTEALASCKVLLVIIGRHWLSSANSAGQPRILETDDWVRREIEAAAQRSVWVLPVLVGGAQMPSDGELPLTLAFVARQQAYAITDRHWDEDVERLADVICERLPALRVLRQQADVTSGSADVRRRWRRMLRKKTVHGTTRPAHRPVSERLWSVLAKVIKTGLTLVVIALIAHFLILEYGNDEMKRLPSALHEYLTGWVKTIIPRFGARASG